MPILPSIRAITPLSNTVTAQAHGVTNAGHLQQQQLPSHYFDFHKQDAERAMGNTGPLSPPSSHKEGFFSHLRKRARRISGRNQSPPSTQDELEAYASNDPWSSYRIPPQNQTAAPQSNLSELDKALQNVKHSLDTSAVLAPTHDHYQHHNMDHPAFRHQQQYSNNQEFIAELPADPIPAAKMRVAKKSSRPNFTSSQYDIPDEQDELLHDVLASAHAAATHMEQQYPPQQQQYAAYVDDMYPEYSVARKPSRPALRHAHSEMAMSYPSPSASAQQNNVNFGNSTKPMEIAVGQEKSITTYSFPTPPYEENEWAASAAASIFAAGNNWK